MTDDPQRPTSINDLPSEFRREIVLDVALNQLNDALHNHLLLTLDQVLAVLSNTYGEQIETEIRDGNLIVHKVYDTGRQAQYLTAMQANWDDDHAVGE